MNKFLRMHEKQIESKEEGRPPKGKTPPFLDRGKEVRIL